MSPVNAENKSQYMCMYCMSVFGWLTSSCSSGISLSHNPRVLQTVWAAGRSAGQVLQPARAGDGFNKSSLCSDVLRRSTRAPTADSHLRGEKHGMLCALSLFHNTSTWMVSSTGLSWFSAIETLFWAGTSVVECFRLSTTQVGCHFAFIHTFAPVCDAIHWHWPLAGGFPRFNCQRKANGTSVC